MGKAGLQRKSQPGRPYGSATHFYDHRLVMICHITTTAANVAAKSRPWPIIVNIFTPAGFPCPSFMAGTRPASYKIYKFVQKADQF